MSTTHWYTCRHGCEAILVAELARLGWPSAAAVLPGLVRGGAPSLGWEPSPVPAPAPDPIYALQILPNALGLPAPSIKALAHAVWELARPLVRRPGAAWDLHVLVPGQLKGNPKPPLQRRAGLVAEAVLAVARQRDRTLARGWIGKGLKAQAIPQVLVQVLLMEADRALVSVAAIEPLAAGASWPSRLPAGLAVVADDPLAPASSFRKLEEAFACLAVSPQVGDLAVDLGACPGGWTRVLRRCGATVVAVDRSPLAAALMADPDVHFVQGDAFVWRPQAPVDWLVSDIVAYPGRIVELLNVWCGGHLARHMVVQMKFKGDPDWAAIDDALATARQHGYHARARHFFNDKNEVTWLLVAPPAPSPPGEPP